MAHQMAVKRPTAHDRHRWLDWLAAADPGETRLLNAIRATLAAVASMVAAILLTGVFARGQQLTTITALVLALVTTMLSMVLVSDVTISAQKITTLLLFLPIACSAVVAALVTPLPWLGDILLLACIFLAYYVRRFGARLAALGMMAVSSFLIPLNTHAKVAQIPWLVIMAGVVVSFAYLFRFVILPPHPARILSRSIAAFHTRAAMALDRMIALAEDPGPDKIRTKRLRRSINRLYASAKMIEGQLASPDSRSVLPEAQLDQLRFDLFNAELSIETLSQATGHLAALDVPIPADVENLANQALQVLDAWLCEPDAHASTASVVEALDTLDRQLRSLGSDPGGQSWAFPLFRMESAIRQFVESARQTRQTSMQLRSRCRTAPVPNADPSQPSTASSPSTTQPQKGQDTPGSLRPTTLLAIKALLASGMSIPIGLFLSPSHPYWVLIAAYTVITVSFGAVLKTALERTLAAVIGSLVGFGWAAGLSGIPEATGITILLILVCFFLNIYFSLLSPVWLVFWLAVLFALLFSLSGGLGTTLGILADRMIDILVGCTLGTLVTIFVFPAQRTGDLFSQNTISFLSALKDQISNGVASLTEKDAEGDVKAGGHTIDNQFEAITKDAGALKYEASVLGQDRRQVERQLMMLGALNSYANQLARFVIQGKTFTADPNLGSILKDVEARIMSNIDALCQLLTGKQQQSVRGMEDMRTRIQNTVDVKALLTAPDSAEAHSMDMLYSLWFINLALVKFAGDLGARVLCQD